MAFMEDVENAKKVAEAIEAVSKILSSLYAARSVILEIDNHTDFTLNEVSEHHNHGDWAPGDKN